MMQFVTRILGAFRSVPSTQESNSSKQCPVSVPSARQRLKGHCSLVLYRDRQQLIGLNTGLHLIIRSR